jgi:hypothetical protein
VPSFHGLSEIKEPDRGPAAAPTSIVVVQNWLEDLKRLVPAN